MNNREEEVNALWEEYKRVHTVYWTARCEAVGKAVDSVSDLKAASDKSYETYRVARYPRGGARRTASEEISAAIVAPLEQLALQFPWPSFRAVGKRIFGRKK